MNQRAIIASLIMVATIFSAAARAHHSGAAYGAAPIVLKTATFKSLVWANPHIVMRFETRNEKGQLVTWNIESGSPSALTRMGWQRNSLKAGDAVMISVFAARNGAPVGRLEKLTFPDGKELRDSAGTEGSAGAKTYSSPSAPRQ